MYILIHDGMYNFYHTTKSEREKEEKWMDGPEGEIGGCLGIFMARKLEFDLVLMGLGLMTFGDLRRHTYRVRFGL